jgi:hypothetical protein
MNADVFKIKWTKFSNTIEFQCKDILLKREAIELAKEELFKNWDNSKLIDNEVIRSPQRAIAWTSNSPDYCEKWLKAPAPQTRRYRSLNISGQFRKLTTLKPLQEGVSAVSAVKYSESIKDNFAKQNLNPFTFKGSTLLKKHLKLELITKLKKF